MPRQIIAAIRIQLSDTGGRRKIAARRTPLLKNLISTVAVLATLALSVPAHAEAEHQTVNEIDGTTNAALSFGSGTTTSFGIGAGYSRTLLSFLQGTAFGTFVTGGGASFLTATVGPTLNLVIDEHGFSNAFFLTTAGGIVYQNSPVTTTTNGITTSVSSASSTSFAYNLQAGKRFLLFSSVSWKPAIIMTGTTTTGTSPLFQLVPLFFSFEF
jgi:hypothetical protein